jgi:hypothetical protein
MVAFSCGVVKCRSIRRLEALREFAHCAYEHGTDTRRFRTATPLRHFRYERANQQRYQANFHGGVWGCFHALWSSRPDVWVAVLIIRTCPQRDWNTVRTRSFAAAWTPRQHQQLTILDMQSSWTSFGKRDLIRFNVIGYRIGGCSGSLS